MKRGFLGPSRKEPAEGSVIPDVIDVAETNTFNLTSQWYDWRSEDPFYGLPHEDPKDLIKRLEKLASANKHDEISADYFICKIFPYCLSRDAFSWFSKLQPRSLTCWEDIKEAFIGKFFSEAVATRSKRLDKMIKNWEKGIMISMSQILDFVYSEENGDIGTPTTHVRQPDIQVHHADESKQKDDLNREKLVNHDTVKDDEYHVSGEQSKVEGANTKDPTSASIDSNFLELEEFLELEDGQQLGDLDSSEEETMEDFLELEEWLENLDHNPKQKFDDQHTSGRGYPIEQGPIEEIMHMSKTSHLAVPEHLRPPICAEEAVGICKRVKRIHDPVKIMVPCAVFEVESPIPPDKGVYLSSYIEVLNDQHHVEAYQRGLRFRDEEDNCPAEVPSSNINKTKLIDTNTSSSIDTDQIPSIDTRRESEQNEHELCGNIFYGDTTTHSDKSGGTKWRNWKKKKRINECSQISLIPHFSDDTRKSRVRLHKSVRKNGRNWKKQKRTKGGSQLPLTPYFSDSIRKSRVRSKCFSHPYAKLKALLIAEMIDKGEGYMEEAFTQE
ncbi:hypothetical protein IGI04_007259 [Brassica rapa subsp. trilocularis]|uniref:Retrotransposon gag domain-containing protein n=1 Tax=Brassica rapa subsp. trilocularis TaxID=1813537 RepID=A0ABQ7NJC4_BRACM|nr:hypothetical protein IGI04_007259 [Brassica rapa subsp. trilocularis]